MLVAIGIAIALLIELFNSNGLQEWMERCFFGSISEGERYENIEEVLSQFVLAMNNLAKNNGERDSEETVLRARWLKEHNLWIPPAWEGLFNSR